MISNNICDLEGMVFQVIEKVYDTHISILFNLSIPDSYQDANGDWQTRYDSILCIYSKKKEHARNEAKYNWLIEQLKDQSVIRVQGKLGSWIEEIGDRKITSHAIRLQNFKIVKFPQNSIDEPVADPKNVENQNLEESSHSEALENTPTQSDNYKVHSDLEIDDPISSLPFPMDFGK